MFCGSTGCTFCGDATTGGDWRVVVPDPEEIGLGISVDDSGKAIVGGYTSSSNFPITTGATLQGVYDTFVTKVDTANNSILFSTLVGGDGRDITESMTVDGDGNIYLTGRTDSTNFPLQNELQSANAGDYDVFVFKLSPDGNSLLFSTPFGGSEFDRGNGIAI